MAPKQDELSDRLSGLEDRFETRLGCIEDRLTGVEKQNSDTQLLLRPMQQMLSEIHIVLGGNKEFHQIGLAESHVKSKSRIFRLEVVVGIILVAGVIGGNDLFRFLFKFFF